MRKLEGDVVLGCEASCVLGTEACASPSGEILLCQCWMQVALFSTEESGDSAQEG